jgi:hypothetical protein
MHIVNFKHYWSTERLAKAFGDRWVYIGRAMPNYLLKRSPLANPVWLGIDTPEERQRVLDQYRPWFIQQLHEGNMAVIDAFNTLKEDSVLVCWCAPKLCHGEVIREKWLQMKEDDIWIQSLKK